MKCKTMKDKTTTVRQVQADGMTPLALSVLLHYHYACEPYHRPGPAYDTAIRELLEFDMIVKVGIGETFVAPATVYTGFVYETTEKGAMYIQYLLNTPLPKQRCHWEIPHRKDGGQT